MSSSCGPLPLPRLRRLWTIDLVFFVPAGRHPSAWPREAYEPLIVGVFLPLPDSAPWVFRQSAVMPKLEADLRACWRSDADDTALLASLWHLAGLT